MASKATLARQPIYHWGQSGALPAPRPRAPQQPRRAVPTRRTTPRPADPRTPRTYPVKPTVTPGRPPPDYNPRPIVPKPVEPVRIYPDRFKPEVRPLGVPELPLRFLARAALAGLALDDIWNVFAPPIPLLLGSAKGKFQGYPGAKGTCGVPGGYSDAYYRSLGGSELCPLLPLWGQVQYANGAPPDPVPVYVGPAVGGTYVQPYSIGLGRGYNPIGGQNTRLIIDTWTYFDWRFFPTGTPVVTPVIRPIYSSVGAHPVDRPIMRQIDAMQTPIMQPVSQPVSVPYWLIPILANSGKPMDRDPLESSLVEYPQSAPGPAAWVPPYVVPSIDISTGSTELQKPPVLNTSSGSHSKTPPPPGERERKLRAQPVIVRSIIKGLGHMTEAGDLIDSFYKAIPAKGTNRRWKGRDGKWREAAISPQDKLAFVYKHWSKVDLSEAFKNVVENEIEDRVIGGASNALKSTYKNNPYMQKLRGFQSGPAF